MVYATLLIIASSNYIFAPSSRTQATGEISSNQAIAKYEILSSAALLESPQETVIVELATDSDGLGGYEFSSDGFSLKLSSRTGTILSYSSISRGHVSRPFMPRANLVLDSEVSARSALERLRTRVGVPNSARLQSFKLSDETSSGPGTAIGVYQLFHNQRRLIHATAIIEMERFSGKPVYIFGSLDYHITTENPTLLEAEAKAKADQYYATALPNAARRKPIHEIELCYLRPTGKLGGPAITFTNGKPNYRIGYRVQYGEADHSVWVDATNGRLLGGRVN